MEDINCNDCLTDTEFDTSKPQTCWRNQSRIKPKTTRKCSVKKLSYKVVKVEAIEYTELDSQAAEPQEKQTKSEWH